VKGHGAKFGRKKEAAIAALLTAKNYEEAARATGIGLKTLKRWLREALTADPLDACYDAQLLAAVLRQRVEELLETESHHAS